MTAGEAMGEYRIRLFHVSDLAGIEMFEPGAGGVGCR